MEELREFVLIKRKIC